MKKLLPPKLFMLIVVGMVVLRFMTPGGLLLGWPANLLGLAPLALGLGFAVAGSMRFERVGTNIKTFQRPQVLVTDGLFRISRNPMYLGFVVALVGVWLLLGSVTPLLGVALFFIAADRWYIAFEERTMHDTFGHEYQAYKQRTRRWL